MVDAEEFERWLRQAEHNLQSAERDRCEGDYSWGAFKAQQAGELALKALLRGLGALALGHSVTALLREVGDTGVKVGPEEERCARQLERHYIPTRYPDAYPKGSPFEFYDEQETESALECARCLLDFVSEAFEDAKGH